MRLSPITLFTALAALAVAACGDDTRDGTAADVATDDATVPDDATAPGDATGDATGSPDVPGPVENAHVVTLLEHEPVVLAAGTSMNLVVEVPDDVVSITVSVLGESDGMYGLAQWRGPDDTVLVTPGWLDGDQQGICLSCDNRIALSEGDFAALAPNNPSAVVTAGTHVLSVYGVRQPPSGAGGCGDGLCDSAGFEQFTCAQDCQPVPMSGDVFVSVHAKVIDGGAVPDTGVLDLNLHFTGAKGWTAATAPTDPELQGLIESVRTLYGQVGIRLGAITYRDIGAEFKVIESVQGADSDLMALFQASDGATEGGLNLFFVEELSAGAFGGLGVILGVAGGIPGPPLVAGTHRSGVAISVKEIEGAPAGIDTTIAHEMGHFLGLFHTSEQSFFGLAPEIHDPLPDTPDNDESYLMFNTGAGAVLSPWQGRVMRNNPLVRHEQEDL